MNLRSVYRIVVFVPQESVPALQQALCSTGALRYGKYSDVLWLSSAGKESFTPLAGSAPSSGNQGEMSTLASVQVVFTIARDDEALRSVIAAIQSAHPWEEPVVYVDETFALSSQA